MLVTLSGIEIKIKLLQSENIASLSDDKFEGRLALVRLVHLKKTYLPMLVMLFGRLIEARLLQLAKAIVPSAVTLSGIEIFCRELQL